MTDVRAIVCLARRMRQGISILGVHLRVALFGIGLSAVDEKKKTST